MPRPRRRLVLLLPLLLLLLPLAGVARGAVEVAVEAPVIRQTFKLDSRDEIRLGHFGFVTGGFWNMTLNGLEMQDVRTAYSQTEATNNLVGIAFKRSTTMAGVASDLLLCTTPAEDVLSGQANPDVEFHAFTNDTTGWSNYTVFSEDTAALWSIVMVNCRSSVSLSFEIAYQMQNPGPEYVSIGEKPLPLVLGLYAILFIGMTGVWLFMLTYSRDRRVLWPHWVMLGLFFITGLSLALDAMKYQYRLMGIDSTGWAISSYVFLFIKGGLHFGILFLVATGWVFIKPYLTEREKMVLAVVLILQVISNIAYVVYTQVSETSVVWSFWRSLFVFVDIICCAIVFAPILQTKQQLAESDPEGKAEMLKTKYKLWGRLYVIIFVYSYFTRIVVSLMESTFNYKISWLGQFFQQLSTAAFYIFLVYSFRPVIDNPYFEVNMEEDDFEEIPLETFGRLRHRDATSRQRVNDQGESTNVAMD